MLHLKSNEPNSTDARIKDDEIVTYFKQGWPREKVMPVKKIASINIDISTTAVFMSTLFTARFFKMIRNCDTLYKLRFHINDGEVLGEDVSLNKSFFPQFLFCLMGKSKKNSPLKELKFYRIYEKFLKNYDSKDAYYIFSKASCFVENHFETQIYQFFESKVKTFYTEVESFNSNNSNERSFRLGAHFSQQDLAAYCKTFDVVITN